ncbi:MAG: GNAT family N-acetyltransferase [Ignavibacteriaceae bacterium]|nr:GNAT family N-acetyltransferase [Ignavibacteriaceae bacterium]
MKIPLGDFYIRSFEHSDKDSLVKYANNTNVSKNLRDRFPSPYKDSDAEEWLMFACNQNPELSFAIASNKELIGGIGIVPQEDINKYSVEIGYWLAESFWGKGIATAALSELTKYTFNNFNFNRIFASLFEGNRSSERVLQKAGFKKEATLRKAVYKREHFLDQYVYSILREECLIIK